MRLKKDKMPNIDKDCTKVYEPEFNLSNKIFIPANTDINPIIWARDVKEFIKRLKEEIPKELDIESHPIEKRLFDCIDKLAGDKLIS